MSAPRNPLYDRRPDAIPERSKPPPEPEVIEVEEEEPTAAPVQQPVAVGKDAKLVMTPFGGYVLGCAASLAAVAVILGAIKAIEALA